MYEFLVGLDVSDNEVYSDYRAAMKPILTSYGGEFGFDFIVSEVLRSEVDKPINRVLTIRFPDQSVAENFFTDSEYLKVKEQLFDTAVSHTTIISSYNKEV